MNFHARRLGEVIDIGTVGSPGRPSETRWTRLLPRPRDADMTEALRAEIHDPLWLLSRQWQFREFRGEDAGSPVRAELRVERDHLVSYDLDPSNRREESPGPQPHREEPLEALVERESIVEGSERVGGPPLRVAAAAGLHFLRLLDEEEYHDEDGTPYAAGDFPATLRLSEPDVPLEAGDQRYASVMADRALDGHAIFEQLDAAVPDIAEDDEDAETWGTDNADPPLPTGGSVTAAYRKAAAAFHGWYRTFYYEPTAESGSAWRPERMEYAFAVATGARANQAVLVAPEYVGGDLDWDAFSPAERTAGEDLTSAPSGSTRRQSPPDLDDAPRSRGAGRDIGRVSFESAPALDGDEEVTDLEAAFLQADESFASETATSVFETDTLPTKVTFPGMPASRWWEFEDSAVTLTDIAADGASIPRLLLLEFAVQFGDDWFQVPVPTPVGSYNRVTNLTIHDSFGVPEGAVPVQERTDEWNMFMFASDARDSGLGIGIQHDRPGLFLPPTLGRSGSSDPVEQVLLTRDELANLAFGIERRVEGPIGTPIDRGTFRKPRLEIEHVTPDDDPTAEYVEFTNPGEDDLEIDGWVVEREVDDAAEDVYQFEDVTLGPESTLRLYTGMPAEPDSGPGVDVRSCDRDASLWMAADLLSVYAPDDGDEATDRRLVLRHPFGTVEAAADYRIASDVPDHWFPFTMELGGDDESPTFDPGADEYFLELALLLDASTLGVDPAYLPTPQGRILNPDPAELRDEDRPEDQPPQAARFSPLRVFEEEIPRSGVEVTRQYQLARWIDGRTYLWSGRRVTAGEPDASSGLRFDFLEERATGGSAVAPEVEASSSDTDTDSDSGPEP